MLQVDFKELNHRCERAVQLTRTARQLEGRHARRAGEAAARVLQGVISDMWESRRQLNPAPARPPMIGRHWLQPL